MYKKVLAAINEHLNSEVTARYALHLARRANARIVLCSIAQRGISEKSFQNAELAVKRLAALAREMDVQADCVLETGDAVEQINKIVKSESIDIVFAATRHEDISRRFYARTVARQLSLGLPCSVALVRVVHLGHVHPRTILVPLRAGMSFVPERAYFTALLAGAFNSKIHVFHTTKPITQFFRGEIHLRPAEWESRLPADIMQFIEYLNRYELAHEKRLMPGITGRSITTEAAVKKHELIIMGASERSLMNSLIKGNPVERVLRETPCDLIIFKPKRTIA